MFSLMPLKVANTNNMKLLITIFLSLFFSAAHAQRFKPDTSVQCRLVSWELEGRGKAKLVTVTTKGDTMRLLYGWHQNSKREPHFRKGLWITVQFDTRSQPGHIRSRITIND